MKKIVCEDPKTSKVLYSTVYYSLLYVFEFDEYKEEQYDYAVEKKVKTIKRKP